LCALLLQHGAAFHSAAAAHRLAAYPIANYSGPRGEDDTSSPSGKIKNVGDKNSKFYRMVILRAWVDAEHDRDGESDSAAKIDLLPFQSLPMALVTYRVDCTSSL
jgi:hypothetical protein